MKRIIVVICFFSVLTTLVSCSNDAKEFEGKWELITAPVTGFDYFWSFYPRFYLSFDMGFLEAK